MADGTEGTRVVPARFGPWRREARSFLELFALTGIAIVQPALDVLRRNSKDVFVAGGTSRFQLLALVLLLLLAPPLALWAVEVVVGLIRPVLRRYAHVVLAGAVVGLIVFELVSRQTELDGLLRVALVVLGGVGGALLLLRVDVAGMFLRYLAVAPVAFAVLFLMNAQISPLWLSGDVANADVEIRRPSRVVMLVMDEFPLESLLDGRGQVDATLFPNFAALAQQSNWYRNATSVSPLTTTAVPALLTGDYPTDPRALQTAAEYPHNLFTLLGGRYEINAHEHLEGMNPGGDAGGSTSFRRLLRRTADLWERTITDAPFEFEIPEETAELQAPAWRKFVRSLRAGPQEQLDYLHVLLPHSPWYHLPDGRTYTTDTHLPGFAGGWAGTWGGGPELAAVARQRHILQLQYTDRLLGDLVAKLRRLDVYDDTLFVVTADHGEAFTGNNPQRVTTPANYSEVMWVPLFIKAPGQTQGRVDDRPAPSVDVLPTMAEILGIDLPWKVDGRSLLGEPRTGTKRRFLETTVHASNAPAEAKYREWDGIRGFERVLAARAAAPGANGAMRVYQGTSEFGALVGAVAAPLVDADVAPVDGWIAKPWQYANVQPDAPFAPWTYLEGHVTTEQDTDLAIAVNGEIASIADPYPDRIFGGRGFAALLPPSAFRPGANDVQLYLVTGTPGAPRLVPVRRTGELGAGG